MENKSDEEIKSEWKELDQSDIDKVCDILRRHEPRIQEYIADYVAALCNVDKDEMMTDCSKVRIVHARWLFWYTYRYITDVTYGSIMEMTRQRWGVTYTEPGICHSVNEMSKMIDQNTIWTKRWNIIKRIVSLREDKDNTDDNVIVINTPKKLRIEIKQKSK